MLPSPLPPPSPLSNIDILPRNSRNSLCYHLGAANGGRRCARIGTTTRQSYETYEIDPCGRPEKKWDVHAIARRVALPSRFATHTLVDPDDPTSESSLPSFTSRKFTRNSVPVPHRNTIRSPGRFLSRLHRLRLAPIPIPSPDALFIPRLI